MKFLIAALILFWAAAASATCTGTDLLARLPAEQRAKLDVSVADVPFHEGLLWQARKNNAEITLAGTFHFGDPRHQRLLDEVSGPLASADALYVEAGPEEEAKLTAALSTDPDLMVNADGPTLPERLSDAEWQIVREAMAERGTPSVVTAKLKPWFVSMMLSISPCMMQTAAAGDGLEGLDHLLITKAESLSVPVHALEPWDTVFTVFEGLTPEQEDDMIRTWLPAAQYADDFAVTMTNAYFAEDVWLIWEFGRQDALRNTDLSPEVVDQQFDFAQARLMDHRNASWIAALTSGADQAAKQGKGVVAAFGALHLPGEGGVLRLLEKDGWTIKRVTISDAEE